MNTKQFLQEAGKIIICCQILLAMTQPCLAQEPASDSLLKSSLLYQKGKKNITVGGTLFGVGVVGSLISLAMGEEKPSSGWEFGPSDREVMFFLSGVVGTIGVLKLLQGGVRIQKARMQLRTVRYQRVPGQQALMPALSMHWSLSEILSK